MPADREPGFSTADYVALPIPSPSDTQALAPLEFHSLFRLFLNKQGGANGLLQAFRSPVFDTSMSRKPSAVSVTDFLSGDRHSTAAVSASTSSSSLSSMTDGGGDSVLDAHEDDTTVGGAGEQRRRRLSGTEQGMAHI